MELRVRDRTLALGGPPHVMGIVNVTPDSFYDRGQTAAPEDAVARARVLAAAGASIVDVGGLSAQPGALIPAAQEAARVAPVIETLRARLDVVVSVDTWRAEVAAAALDAGAHIVNDHTGLSDAGLAEVVAARDAGLVVTHLGLAPKAAQDGRYSIPPRAICRFLAERAEQAMRAGVRRDALLLDPGLGFGKTSESDLATLRRLPELRALGYAILLAPSHKEVTAEPLGLPEESLEGTAAVVAVAAYLGVDVLRLHDLPFMRHVATMGWLLRDHAEGGERSGANAGTKAPSR